MAIKPGSRNGDNFVHNKEIGLREWRAARAKALTGATPKLHVNLVGDSISEGSGSTNNYTKGMGGMLRSHLTSSPFPNTGLGFIPAHYATSEPSKWLTLSGSWNDGDGTFGVGKKTKTSSTVGNTATFTFTGTGFVIHYAQRSGGGSFSVVVDGGAPTTVNTNGAISHQKSSQFGMASGSHTVVITVTAGGTAGVSILGYETSVGATSGIQFNLMAKYGSIVADHTAPFQTQIEIDQWTPKLTMIALMANDFGGQTSLNSYYNGIKTLIEKARAHGDVLLISTGLRKDNSTAIKQKAYNDILMNLAYAKNVAFLDIFNAWGADFLWHQSNMGLIKGAGDDVHPLDEGHKDIVDRIISVLN